MKVFSKIILSILLVFAVNGNCSTGAKPIVLEFGTEFGKFQMRPIHMTTDKERLELMTESIFHGKKPNNYKYYENGKPWDAERTEGSLKSKVARSEKWEEDLLSFSWYIIFDSEDKPQALLGTYLEPETSAHAGYLQICYAKDTYNKGLKGVMGMAYKCFMEYFSMTLLGCKAFKGLYAPVNPKNAPSAKWLESLGGWVNKGPIPGKERDEWLLSRDAFKEFFVKR